MINEYCPKCCELTAMTVTTTEREEKDGNEKKFKILTNSYHCNNCNSFVRSEDIKTAVEDEEK